MLIQRARSLSVRLGVVGALALATTFGSAAQASAAGPAVGIPNSVCDVSTSPRKISVAPPVVTAINDTTSTDRNYVRFWVRLFNTSTGAVVTDWTYAGQTTSTDTTPGVFPTAGTAFGTPYSVQYTTTSTASLRVQYSIAWYRTDWTLRAADTYIPTQFKLVSMVSMYPYGSVPAVTGTNATC
jgi:hypothetical protein